MSPTFQVELLAFGLASADDVAARISSAISVLDDSGQVVPTAVKGRSDEDGITHLTIEAATAQARDHWYYLSISATPGSVELETGEPSWAMNLYVGDTLYVERLLQGTDPKKADVVTLRFSQKIDFDAAWAGRLLTDASGQALDGCLEVNSTCQTSGRFAIQEAQIRLASGGASRMLSLKPLGTVSAVNSRVGKFTNGSLATQIKFQPCQQSGARCAWF